MRSLYPCGWLRGWWPWQATKNTHNNNTFYLIFKFEEPCLWLRVWCRGQTKKNKHNNNTFYLIFKYEEPLPLFVAVWKMQWPENYEDYLPIARLLLQCGADPNLPAEKNYPWSTYRFCVHYRGWGRIFKNLVSLLEQFGGKARFIILYCFPEYKYTG